MDCLPAWIDRELWEEYVTQRKRDKKEMSPRSVKARIARLYELHRAGHDANQALEEALNGHWLDFYEPQDKAIQCAKTQDIQKTQDWIAEHSKPSKIPEGWASDVKAKLRRVA